MADDSGSGPKKTKILDLGNIFPKPTAVETSQGVVYTTHISVGDHSKLANQIVGDEPEDPRALGISALRLLTLATADRDNALAPELFEKLSEADLKAIAKVVIVASNGFITEDSDPIEQLGQLTHRDAIESRKQNEEIFKRFKNPFGFGAAAEMQKQLSKINGIGDSLKALRHGGDHVGTFGSRDLGGGIRTAMPEHTVRALPDLGRTYGARTADAAEETAEKITEVAIHIGEMASAMGELTTTIVYKAMPTWLAKMEEDQAARDEARAMETESLNATLAGEKRNLFWTQVALGLTLVSGILTTAWQMNVAKDYKEDNDQQQDRIEALIADQVKLTKQLSEQQGILVQIEQKKIADEEQRKARSLLVKPANPASPRQKGRL